MNGRTTWITPGGQNLAYSRQAPFFDVAHTERYADEKKAILVDSMARFMRLPVRIVRAWRFDADGGRDG